MLLYYYLVSFRVKSAPKGKEIHLEWRAKFPGSSLLSLEEIASVSNKQV